MIGENKLRICMVSYLFFPHYSGDAVQALNLSKELARQGHSIFFVAGRLQDDPEFHEHEGFRVHRIKAGRGIVGLLGFWMRLFFFLARKRGSYDIIHSRGLSAFEVLIGIFARLLGKKAFVTFTMSNTELDFRKWGRIVGRFGRMTFIFFHRFIPISSRLRAELEELGITANRIVDIPTGVDTSLFYPISLGEKDKIRAALKIKNQKVVSFVGMIIPRKGVDVLVDAWCTVIQKYPSACLLIIGPRAPLTMHASGPTFFDNLNRKISHNGLTDSIRFLGQRNDVYKLLQASDIYVLPSQLEGLPNSLLEAMACGLPCIATRLSGTEDVITNGGNGLLVEYGDRESLQACLIRLLGDGGLCEKIGANAVRTIKASYSLSMVVESYGRVYAELLEGKATP
jgi:glycosyltransferase involved in cell wall biosynthesis